jgi:cystathionine beta-lyase
VEHGVFGYEHYAPDLPALITDRLARVFDWHVAPEAIVFTPGVVTAFFLAVRALVAPNEGLLTQRPVYGPILHAADTAGVVNQAMELTRQSDGRYVVDMDRFRATITDQTKLFLLCNPHNPVGRVFTPEELQAMGEVCLRNEVSICSDEIHGDLTFSGHPHRPIAALSSELGAVTITLMAPSKTFNIAGLDCGFAVIPNPELRQRYTQARAGLVGRPNLMGYTAARAAYLEGEPWLQAVLDYMEANRDFVVDYVNRELPGLRVTAPEGTYLAWIDCREAELSPSPHTFFLEHAKVAFNDGTGFGPSGEGFIRLNFGCPRSLLEEGLTRMRAALMNR